MPKRWRLFLFEITCKFSINNCTRTYYPATSLARQLRLQLARNQIVHCRKVNEWVVRSVCGSRCIQIKVMEMTRTNEATRESSKEIGKVFYTDVVLVAMVFTWSTSSFSQHILRALRFLGNTSRWECMVFIKWWPNKQFVTSTMRSTDFTRTERIVRSCILLRKFRFRKNSWMFFLTAEQVIVECSSLDTYLWHSWNFVISHWHSLPLNFLNLQKADGHDSIFIFQTLNRSRNGK